MLLIFLSAKVTATEAEGGSDLAMLSLAYLKGAESKEVILGVGVSSQQFSSDLFLSSFSVNDGPSAYRSKRMGLKLSAYERGVPWTLDLGLYGYHNHANIDFDRYGFGFILGAGVKLGDHNRVLAVAEAMPEWLSTDWDAAAFVEYTAKLYWEYIPTVNLALRMEYRRGGVFDNSSPLFYRQTMAGITLRL